MAQADFTIGQTLGALQFPGQSLWKDCIITQIGSAYNPASTKISLMNRASKRFQGAQVEPEELRQVMAHQTCKAPEKAVKVTVHFRLKGAPYTYTHKGTRAEAYTVILTKYPEAVFYEP